ncbi:hypothetical protein H2O64_04625 [Kordia sp. YSTF-M3]|uniref:HTH cro/C1-type domain-containing protein n=1 Tax=Kordia aestuariivivens TaxID=2759037 RepID=A0ABR7Q620_9FLAO|nr:hypothetical protein [Kordia aestuariivivens]MBC8753943.1 hypothetical protein [Kordia aestuariivivens]
MIEFKEALEYLKKREVTANELANYSELSAGSLFLVLNGTTKNPRRNTKDAVIAYARVLMEKNKEGFDGNTVFSKDENLLDKNDKNYIKKLALEIRANKEQLLLEQSFKDMIYIEALKMALLAKEGESISMEKLIALNN